MIRIKYLFFKEKESKGRPLLYEALKNQSFQLFGAFFDITQFSRLCKNCQVYFLFI